MFKTMARVLAATGPAAAATLGFGGAAQADAVSLCYTPHVQNVGWKGKVCQGSWAGSIGEARNLEALCVEINHGSLCMKAHRADLDAGTPATSAPTRAPASRSARWE
ncbi:hypothetical protein [Streptomyces hydrogenans]